MTASAARTVANVVLLSAGAAAAYAIIASPPLRRIAGHGLRWWLGATVPVYIIDQVRQAWERSASPVEAPARSERPPNA